MPPDVSQVSHDCGDDPDAATKLKEWLGISGPDVQALSSCQDFARMGLLGVPFCSNLPKVYRCLCATTCRCPCQNSTCDCEALQLMGLGITARFCVLGNEHQSLIFAWLHAL
eukprot:g6247.t1